MNLTINLAGSVVVKHIGIPKTLFSHLEKSEF